MSSNKASMMVGHDRFELSTNGLKVRSERPEIQSDATRSIYGRGSMRPNCGAGRPSFFTEAATAIVALIAMGLPSVSLADDRPDIPLQKCTFPYALAPGAVLNRYCAGPPPVMSLRSGNDRVLVSVARHTDRPIGVVITLYNPTRQTRRGAAVVEFF